MDFLKAEIARQKKQIEDKGVLVCINCVLSDYAPECAQITLVAIFVGDNRVFNVMCVWISKTGCRAHPFILTHTPIALL